MQLTQSPKFNRNYAAKIVEIKEEKSMEKTTRKLNDLLSQFLSLRNEVSEIADKTADAVFDSGDITKEEALTILTDNKLLPVANWVCLP